MIIAVDQLAIAVNKFKSNDKTSALRELGRGLHALQDIFAHTDAFVSLYTTNPINGKKFLGHLGPKGYGADDPFYIDESKFSYPTAVKADNNNTILSQRYSDAKTASYIYLFYYRLLTEGFCRPFNVICSEIWNRINDSVNADYCYYQAVFARYSYITNLPKSRGTHAIYYLIKALNETFGVQLKFSKIDSTPLFHLSQSWEKQYLPIPRNLVPKDLSTELLKTIPRWHLFGPTEKDIENYIKREEDPKLQKSLYNSYRY